MNRRNFLRMTIGGVAAAAAVRTWPFRIYSFPSNLGKPSDLWTGSLYDPLGPYAVMQLWGKAFGSDRLILLGQKRIISGKPVDFSIPPGATISGVATKIPNGQIVEVRSIDVRLAGVLKFEQVCRLHLAGF